MFSFYLLSSVWFCGKIVGSVGRKLWGEMVIVVVFVLGGGYFCGE